MASRLKARDGKNRNKCALDGERGKRIEATKRIRIDSEFMIRDPKQKVPSPFQSLTSLSTKRAQVIAARIHIFQSIAQFSLSTLP